MAMAMSKSKFESELRAKTRALNLLVRLNGAFLGSPVGKAHRVSGSISARFRTVLLRFSFTIQSEQFQSHGHSTIPKSSISATQLQVLGIRVRKLWRKMRGKHQQDCLQGTQAVKPAENLTPVKKTWRRSLSSVGRQLLRRNKSSVKITTQKPVKANGYVAQFMDAAGPDRVFRVVHGVGMVSTVVVLVQLAGTRGLPSLVTCVTALAILGRLVYVIRYAFFGPRLQQLWYETMGVGGIFLVPQVLRALLRPYLPQSGITASESVTGTFTLVLILSMVSSVLLLSREGEQFVPYQIKARYMRLSFKAMWFFSLVSAVIPTIPPLWAPIAHLWTCYWNPATVKFLQDLTGLLGVFSTCLQGCTQRSLDQYHTLRSLHNLV